MTSSESMDGGRRGGRSPRSKSRSRSRSRSPGGSKKRGQRRKQKRSDSAMAYYRATLLRRRVNGRRYVVYVGPRGGRYVKLQGRFVSVRNLPAA